MIHQRPAPYQNPGSQESGLRHFRDSEPCSHRTPTTFAARLLSAVELDRIAVLLRGPQWPAAIDRRLVNLGLAKVVLGKTVAAPAAWVGLWRNRYEVRRGSDAHHLVEVSVIEADTSRDALAAAWDIARRDVGSRNQDRLVQEGREGQWTIFLQPVRTWPAWSVRPYVLHLNKIQP